VIGALATFVKTLFAGKGIEPSYPVLPEVNEAGETNVPGIHAVGEVAGTPLVKLGLNAGHDLVQRLAPLLKSEGPATDRLDLVIVGSGSSGLAAAAAARRLGLSFVVLEAAAFANTFVTMTKGKWLFAEPRDVPNRSHVWFEECTREELLERWRAFVKEEGLDIREHEKVVDIKGRLGDFEVVTDVGSHRARRVILAMGKAGNPRKLGVPGERENAGRIHHRLLDPDDFRGRRVLIVGAGDVACEAAITLARDPSNTVVLSAVDEEFTFPKKRNVDAVREVEAAGRLRVLLGSRVLRIAGESAEVQLRDGSREEIPCDVIFEMIGSELPLSFFKRVGIRIAGSWHPKRWAALAVVFLFVWSLYALKSYGKGLTAWPFEHLIAPGSYDGVLRRLFSAAFAPFRPLFEERTFQDMLGDRGFQQGYLYSLIYTILMVVFGYEALMRWRKKARRPGYQTWRYVSLITFQVAFFLIVNVIAVKALSVKYAWRAWGLYQPFPLFFNTFFWWYPSDPGWIKTFFIGAGVVGTAVAIPWLSRKHGKRFCTWVCGCGGLAETLGDRWRHLAPKGRRSRAWEFQNVVVLLAAFIVLLVVVGLHHTDGNNPWWRAYSYVVDFWLVAVIPVALYPFYGGKVWCRYWCPLASLNGILARIYGRLRITSNDKCISCTECSRYCQVGVDVMSFARNQQAFDNRNSACIQCGICIDVCPMDVLAFDASPTKEEAKVRAGP